MSISSLSDLKAMALSVVAREGDDTVAAYLPTAITIIEAELNTFLRVAQQVHTVTGTSENGVLSLPNDFLAAQKVEAYPYGPLTSVSSDWASYQYPSDAGVGPRYYSIQGLTLATYPSYTGEIALTYYKMIPPLTETAPTNWLLSEYPNVYLFLLVSEANTFLKDFETAQIWNQRGWNAAEKIKGADLALRYSNIHAKVKGPTP